MLRLLESRFEVEKRYGGRFVQAIDGVEGQGAGGVADWFFFVNGVESEVGAAEYELSPGDRVQWDYRDWGAAMRVPAIVGAFPEPFVHGFDGRRHGRRRDSYFEFLKHLRQLRRIQRIKDAIGITRYLDHQRIGTLIRHSNRIKLYLLPFA